MVISPARPSYLRRDRRYPAPFIGINHTAVDFAFQEQRAEITGGIHICLSAQGSVLAAKPEADALTPTFPRR